MLHIIRMRDSTSIIFSTGQDDTKKRGFCANSLYFCVISCSFCLNVVYQVNNSRTF